ncbi:MAG TPA: nicotinate-nucleotide adenylyltransferase [Blastocatellia bacterium]|nr:nicotinate-nucleotide adenylyltransferase [Blastocatellia bacterium]
MVKPLRKKRVGVYGGTFDPIHNGHVEVARAVVEHFELDTLLIVPAASPPHKRGRSISGTFHRYAMSVLATLEVPKTVVSTIEIDGPETPYTYQTLARLKTTYGPQVQLLFVMGSDSFEEMHTWKEPRQILTACSVVVAARPGHSFSHSFRHGFRQGFGCNIGTFQTDLSESTASGGGHDLEEAAGPEFHTVDVRGKKETIREGDAASGYIYLTDYVSNDISSTTIRIRAYRRLSVRDLVPPAVADYMEKYELYRAEEI